MIPLPYIFPYGVLDDSLKFPLKLFWGDHSTKNLCEITKKGTLNKLSVLHKRYIWTKAWRMKLKLLLVGKTTDLHLRTLIDAYAKRLQHYIPFEIMELPDIKNNKNLSKEQQKEKEGELILRQLSPSDYLVLLDERGQQYTSMEMAAYFQKRMNSGIKQLVFVVGGPFGFGRQIYERSNATISLSKMTFSHQMVRLFAIEQFYRAFTILRNEPYHHQ